MYALLYLRYNYLKSWNLEIRETIKLLRKLPLSFDAFAVSNLQNTFMEHDFILQFWHK